MNSMIVHIVIATVTIIITDIPPNVIVYINFYAN